MDFSKLKVANKKAKPTKVTKIKEVTVQETVKSYSKNVVIPDPALAIYKKVYQYCDSCATETVSDIIYNDIKCKVCGKGYKIEKKFVIEPKISPVNDFLLIW